MHIYLTPIWFAGYMSLVSRACGHIVLHVGNRLLKMCITMYLLRRHVLKDVNNFLHAPVLTLDLRSG
jgi:hypothetical protein